MPRKPRVYLPGCAQHIIQRGNNRAACFNEGGDYRAYLSYLKDAAIRHSVAVHAYVLMSNHGHLLAAPEDDRGTGRTMQSLGRRYVQRWNKRYQCSGTLWEERFKRDFERRTERRVTVGPRSGNRRSAHLRGKNQRHCPPLFPYDDGEKP